MGEEPDIPKVAQNLQKISHQLGEPYDRLVAAITSNSSSTNNRVGWLEDQVRDLRQALNDVIETIGDLQLQIKQQAKQAPKNIEHPE